jgi:hypothetical protein
MALECCPGVAPLPPLCPGLPGVGPPATLLVTKSKSPTFWTILLHFWVSGAQMRSTPPSQG